MVPKGGYSGYIEGRWRVYRSTSFCSATTSPLTHQLRNDGSDRVGHSFLRKKSDQQHEMSTLSFEVSGSGGSEV